MACSQKTNNSSSTQKSLEKPSAIADEGSKAMENLEWDKYASLLHPGELQRFKDILMPGIQKIIARDTSDMINVLGKSFSAKEIQSEPPHQFFVDMMSLVFGISPELGNTFKGMVNKDVGAIADGDSLVYVVMKTKMKIGPRDVKEMNVITLSKYNNEWKLNLSSKIEGIAMMVQQSLMR
ncbi:MAG: hypothetical protein GXO93_02140 [FCB group bacterium]|nr:hypothetical protein [FCB group bacterium]